jgi:hypothetical protein
MDYNTDCKQRGRAISKYLKTIHKSEARLYVKVAIALVHSDEWWDPRDDFGADLSSLGGAPLVPRSRRLEIRRLSHVAFRRICRY